jgi:hypothetical protein
MQHKIQNSFRVNFMTNLPKTVVRERWTSEDSLTTIPPACLDASAHARAAPHGGSREHVISVERVRA